MNSAFAAATTSVAFALTLTKRQCNSLLRLYLPRSERERLWVIGVDGLNGLHRRGLVFWNQDESGRPNGFGGLTEAGKLVAALLVEAGLTVEATGTAMTVKREERLAAKEQQP